jgi:type I restriction enzyme S subunit
VSKIDELIREYCPQGVEFKSIEELGDLHGGITGKSKEDFKDGNARFISYMNVFSNMSTDVLRDDFVKIGDTERQRKLEKSDVLFTGSSENPEECGMSSVILEEPIEPLYLNSFSFFFRLKDTSIFLPGFLKYLFRDSGIRKQINQTASGVTRFNISKKRFVKIEIPVPPLEVQKEIVKILDTFTQLEAELSAELEARKAQYEHYRNELLTFTQRNSAERERETLNG